MTPETLFDYVVVTCAADGSAYLPRACVVDTVDGRCRVWIEFVPVGRGAVLRSAVETIRPDRRAAAEWALGLSERRLEAGLNEARCWPSVHS